MDGRSRHTLQQAHTAARCAFLGMGPFILQCRLQDRSYVETGYDKTLCRKWCYASTCTTHVFSYCSERQCCWHFLELPSRSLPFSSQQIPLQDVLAQKALLFCTLVFIPGFTGKIYLYDFWKRARAPRPPNFLGSQRRGSATRRDLSNCTRVSLISRLEASSTYFW